MGKMRCLIVDDEPFALEILADDVGRIPGLELVKTCRSPFEAMRILELIPIDLIFLDIQMPGITGLQFIAELENPPLIIFTTAFEQFAVSAFDLNALDYLLKPIAFKRLVASVDRAQALYALKSDSSKADLTKACASLYVKSEYQTIKIPFDDILYIEGMKDYVKIFMVGKTNPVLTRMNVKSIEARLPGDTFCRIHQSFIVSVNKVEAFQKRKVWIARKEIPVGERFLKNFGVILEGNQLS
ncbi:LytTR family DNA-binding domain-containing protein [Dyadobacter sp. CY261]|uniref:LytR/AlgR family response regulator transcription factor n=1 Tax=Dyadobacter sp. CY261 TaxID=2907203 RepID=UPI001F1F8461|nr:LytTR family DNA-binding domain-containing protein [Dyadobacter sp. CY261]MCF0072824.1 LytTR family DNA-binding domain-containing protein [Dyadobacter sp. CY261]